MGNTFSIVNSYKTLDVATLQETGFDKLCEVSSSIRYGSIEYVSNESCGKAFNLLLPTNVNRQDELEEDSDGWLTKRHELTASVVVCLCNHSKVMGLDIDTSGYTDSSPVFADVEGYRVSDMTWQPIVPQIRIKADTHNYISVTHRDTFSSIRLNVAPGGGVARFRVYGEIDADWSDDTEPFNLASDLLGARIVRWTDSRYANKPNILLDHGTRTKDGWLTPRSCLEKERNDFVIIQLGTPGTLSSIVIDTHGFEHHTPQYVFIQGCYTQDTDPHYDSFAQWINLVPKSAVLAGDDTSFKIHTETAISHIRLYLIPDGGIQQIKVFGYPAKMGKRQLLLEQAPQSKAIELPLCTEEEQVIVETKQEDDDSLLISKLKADTHKRKYQKIK
ncbi:galactose-binding domain-like protein [Gilbertella persicaria]|uniref:galactose-binding domain-like protein n=1 Tax=Gilbertella persicaria TaxID=101096 RepID=UPI002220C84D|nr:galactose-binding domain-like protein [Gilbertella persicaria]KAI8060413.1 galactose-binding domain-like protein [Gilbertella persicaria]